MQNYLLDKFDTGGQVHTEVNKGPFDTLGLVLFLFKYEHVVVKELLQLFVCEVDAQLFETVKLKNTHNITKGKRMQNPPFYGWKLHLVLQLVLKQVGVEEHRVFDAPWCCNNYYGNSQTCSPSWPKITFSISSIQAAKSMPKSIKVHWMPSCLYSSCSSTNIWWLKNCCNFSFVKLIHSCS